MSLSFFGDSAPVGVIDRPREPVPRVATDRPPPGYPVNFWRISPLDRRLALGLWSDQPTRALEREPAPRRVILRKLEARTDRQSSGGIGEDLVLCDGRCSSAGSAGATLFCEGGLGGGRRGPFRPSSGGRHGALHV